MRKVVVQEFVSIDGLAAGANGSVDFVPEATRGDHSFETEQLKFIDAIDTILLGRVTYELFADYWPKVTSGDDKVFADKLNATKKIVFSKTLTRAPWGTWPEATVVRKPAAAEVTVLKGQPGKHLIVWGSISLVQSLISAGLIDEHRLVVCPVVLGEGRPLFGENVHAAMTLADAQRFDRGAVQLRYVPKAADARR